MIRVDGVIDLEAAHWTSIVCAAAYEPGDPRVFQARGRALAELVDHLLARGGYWWSWAGGHYDLLAIADELHRRKRPLLVNRAGSRITSMVTGRLHLHDAYALVPLPLDVACDIAERPRVGGIGWPCRCGQQCGGYCQITTSLPLDQRAQLAAYCLEDCCAGYEVLVALVERARAAGLELRGTVGGTAWASAKAQLGLPDAEWFHGTWRRAARGYYGGRLYVGRAWAGGGDHWDVASAYPAALSATPVPLGPAYEVGGRRAGLAFEHGTPGIYRATVQIPPLEIPPLPWRREGGGLAWPYGAIRGSWTALELRAAMARGATVEGYHGAVVWPEGEAPLFSELMAAWYGHRRAAADAGNGGLAAWWRELANSLTGRLAQRPDAGSVILHPDPERIVVCDGRGRASLDAGCSRYECTGRCGAWRQLDPWGQIWEVPRWRLSASAHVGWAAYLTAAMRVAWLDAADAVGAERIVYGATDSLRVLPGAPPPGACAPGERPSLGQWNLKDRWADWTCIGPGRYRYTDCETGEVIARATGVARMSDREWQAMRTRDQAIVDTRGVATFGEAVASGKLWKRRERVTRITVDTEWRGDRFLAASDGRTYPASREQIQERDRSRRRIRHP